MSKKEILILISSLLVFTSSLVGLARLSEGWNCSPKSIIDAIAIPQRITCELFKQRWDK